MIAALLARSSFAVGVASPAMESEPRRLRRLSPPWQRAVDWANEPLVDLYFQAAAAPLEVLSQVLDRGTEPGQDSE
jgi:hypothetical protein